MQNHLLHLIVVVDDGIEFLCVEGDARLFFNTKIDRHHRHRRRKNEIINQFDGKKPCIVAVVPVCGNRRGGRVESHRRKKLWLEHPPERFLLPGLGCA